MPIYTVEIDGRQYDIEGSRPPSEQEARQAVGAFQQSAAQPAAPTQPPASIRPTPLHQRRIPILSELLQGSGPDRGGTSIEDLVEAIPAAGATAAGFLATRNPVAASAAGATAGEAVRQLFRRAVGSPQATGLVQQGLGLDPNSPEAAAASFGGEGLASLAGGGIAKLLRALSGATGRSAQRSVLNILQARGNEGAARGPIEEMRLARVATDEGVVPAGRGRQVMLDRAREALSGARARATALTAEGTAAGRTVNADPVFQSALAEIPPTPGGFVPRTGQPQRAAAEAAADDVLDLMASRGSSQVPLETAIAERQRLDGLLETMYKAGRDAAPESKAAVQSSADAWRRAIGESYPELGAANLRLSDLIKITQMMEESLANVTRSGAAVGGGEAAAVGAGAVGRLSIPAMLGARALTTAGPFASLSAAGKRVAAKLFEGGARSAQLWVRAANIWGLDEPADDPARIADRNLRARRALNQQAQGVVAP